MKISTVYAVCFISLVAATCFCVERGHEWTAFFMVVCLGSLSVKDFESKGKENEL